MVETAQIQTESDDLHFVWFYEGKNGKRFLDFLLTIKN